MQKNINSEDILRISYLIAGDIDEEKVDAKLYDPNNDIIFERKNENGGEYTQKTIQSGEYKFCIYVPKPGNSYISFEYYTEDENGGIIDMAKDGMQCFSFLIFNFLRNE
jgi:hypothetical protein